MSKIVNIISSSLSSTKQSIYSGFLKYPLSYSVLFGSFITIHIVFYVFLKGTFLYAPFNLWQVVDQHLLRTRPLETLWHLHIQPPLFNAYLSLIEIFFHPIAQWMHWLIYILLGFIGLFCIFHLLLRFRISPSLAVFLSLYCLLSPSWILYENWLMYSFPIMVLLSITGLQCHRFLSRPTLKNGCWLFICMTSLVFLRSLFHLIWFLIIVVMMIVQSHIKTSIILKASVIPLLAIVVLFSKNYILFDNFGSSTWLGPNLLPMTNEIRTGIRLDMIKKGEVSLITTSNPFLHIEQYRGKVELDYDKKTGIPVLDNYLKSNGKVNYNHHLYVDLHKIHLHDAILLLKASPRPYFNKAGESFLRFFQPAWNYPYFLQQPQQVRNAVENWNYHLLNYGKVEWKQQQMTMRKFPKLRLDTILVPFLMGITLFMILMPAKYSGLSSSDSTTLFYCILTMTLIIFAGSFLLAHENNRLHFLLTPYSILLKGLWLQKAIDFIYVHKQESTKSSQ
jgi:hypothetical protein